MGEVKLAQLYNGQKQSILEKVDIAYCIPDEPPETLQKKAYGGYNCLHFAVMRSNLDFINVLLDQGVDLYKQGTHNGETPLHRAIHYRNISESITRYTWNLMGKLGENQLVNTLLSTQVRRNESFNPKCKKGMTHLHIACMVNHTESVKLFVNAGELLDQAINSDEYYLPGYTALHFAVRYSSVESIEILLRNDANIHMRDAKGVSPLDLLIQRLVNMKNFMFMGKRATCSQWQKEIETLEAIAQLFLDIIQPSHVNFVDDTGLSTFQLACVMTDPSFTAEFLTKYCNINTSVTNDSQFWLGWAPLHFAACSSVETFKLLLQNGASIDVQNARGETPLDFCMMRYNPETVHSILSAKDDISNVLLSDGTTRMLDLLLAMNKSDTFSNFLQSLSDVNASVSPHSPILTGYNALHLAITMNEKTKTLQELQKSYAQIKSDSIPKIYNCTKADEKKYMKRINVCLEKSCSVSAKNAYGLSPIHLAFKLGKAEMVNLLLKHCRENVADTNNLSILHIACAIGNENAAKRLIDGGADVNSQTSERFEWFGKPFDVDKKTFMVPVRALSTPLHVAVIFENYDVATYLLRKGADAYARDALGLTPVHLLMTGSTNNFASTMVVRRFLQRIPDLRESVSDDGLTHLHVAAYADDAPTVEKLIHRGSNVNAVFNATVPKPRFDEHPPCEHSFLARHAGKTPLHVAVSSFCGAAVRSLMQNGADIFTRTPGGDTPLQNLADRFNENLGKYFAQRLKRDEPRVLEAIDPCGMTLLHLACATFDLNWTRKLLKRGAEANARMKANTMGKGQTPLHLLIHEASLPHEPPENLEDMVRLLLKHGADATLQDEHFSPLHQAYSVTNPDPLWDDSDAEDDDEQQVAAMFGIADLLLESQKSYAINPVNYDGFSHFHYACSRGKVDIVKKFLDCGVDVNHSTDPFSRENAGFTSLHIAFKNKCESVARLLIERGADVKAEDVSGNTPLHVALSNGVADFEIVRSMLSKGADINATNLYALQKPIDCFLSSSNVTYDKLKFFLDNGAMMNIGDTRHYNTTIGIIMKNAEPRERDIILQEVMKICNLENSFKDSFNAIENIVAVEQDGELTFDYYLEKIQIFMKMGYELDQRNEEGKTALHLAASRYNSEAIEALLVLGARMDVTDNENEPPFTVDVFGFCSTDSEHDTRSLKILSAHTWKLKLVGLKVLESSEEGMKATREDYPLERGLQRRCKEELKKLQQTSIGEHSTMKDFLHGSTLVNEYPTMCFAHRQIVNDFFKCSDTLRRQFPEFAGPLTMQYRKALQREKLYEPGKRAVAAVLRVELPDLCSENVLRYFENEELIQFIKVAQQVTIESD